MKRLFPLILTLLLLLCACGGTAQETQTVSLLKSHETTSYWPEGNDFPAGVSGSWLSVYEYDDRGNQTEEKRYGGEELLTSRRWRYDDRGNQTGQITIDHQGWLPKITSRVKMRYNDAGKLLLQIVYEPWKETQRSIYTYDELGNMTRLEIRNAGGSTIIQDYTYDDRGNQLTATDHSVEGLTRVTRYAYDEAGNQISWHYYENDVLVEYVETHYDSQGRIIFSARYDGAGYLRHGWEYRYNEAAGTSATQYTDGSISTSYYDDQGRILRIEQQYPDGTLESEQTYTYEDIEILKPDMD